jgi:hypothetical protein
MHGQTVSIARSANIELPRNVETPHLADCVEAGAA